ncbi:MAG: biotin synthase [Ottowia sp.]|nr:class I SAM-dependent methyltransferase [Ottowia sp.]
MDEPPTIDPVASGRWLAQRALHSPWLHEEVARRMAERLSWIQLPVQRWVHWEPEGDGSHARALVAARYPQATCFELAAAPSGAATTASRAPQWWQRLRRGHERARPARGTAAPEGGSQLVWANMLLHHSADPRALMSAWLHALDPDGFLMFSCLGPDTLRELAALYEAMGWPPPVSDFTDMHDWGDQLFRIGFAEPVMDMEHITLTFETPARLLQELRGLGRNLHPQRFSGLRTPAWRKRLDAALDQALRPAPGAPLTLTFEVIYGHALRPLQRLSRSGQAPSIEFSLD